MVCDMSTSDEFGWPPLTASLKDKASPVRVFLDRFSTCREIQNSYRVSVGSLVVEGSAAHPGTVGTAFDWMTRFLVHPNPSLTLAILGAAHVPTAKKAIQDLFLLLGYDQPDGRLHAGTEQFIGPTSGSLLAPELLARGCWAFSLLTENYRTGLIPGSPLTTINLATATAEQLLDLAPPAAVTELLALRANAEANLLPALAARKGPWALGPTFAGSRLMKADADLIAAGLLLELKTNLGNKRVDGSRQASLDGATIAQLLGYVLLDSSDEFEIDEVGVYNARYAHVAIWPLRGLLDELAGRAVDLAAERAAFRALLAAGHVG